MRALPAAALLLLAVPAYATPPHELFGFYSGQILKQALAVAKARKTVKCDFKGVWKCLAFTADYLGGTANVSVLFDGRKTVSAVQFDILKPDPAIRWIAQARVTRSSPQP